MPVSIDQRGRRQRALARRGCLAVAFAAAFICLPLASLQAQSPEPAAPPAPIGPETPDVKSEGPTLFGAVAFTADGSFASAWQWRSKEAVEERVMSQCVRFNRGHCELATVRDGLCASIATFQRGLHKVTYAGAGMSSQDARRVALRRCNADSRAGGKCEIRTTVCSDRKG